MLLKCFYPICSFLDPLKQKHTLKSEGQVLSPSASIEGEVIIDQSVGKYKDL